MLALGLLSILLTPKAVRRQNEFSYGPILEVAALFIGIFLTMIPALQILNARGPELGLSRPWHYFWITGSLSSFLDNAPTYLTFAAVAAGTKGVSVADATYLADFLHVDGGDALLAQDRAFAQAVRERGAPLVSGEDGYRALDLALRIQESIPPLEDAP